MTLYNACNFYNFGCYAIMSAGSLPTTLLFPGYVEEKVTLPSKYICPDVQSPSRPFQVATMLWQKTLSTLFHILELTAPCYYYDWQRLDPEILLMCHSTMDACDEGVDDWLITVKSAVTWRSHPLYSWYLTIWLTRSCLEELHFSIISWTSGQSFVLF